MYFDIFANLLLIFEQDDEKEEKEYNDEKSNRKIAKFYAVAASFLHCHSPLCCIDQIAAFWFKWSCHNK